MDRLEDRGVPADVRTRRQAQAAQAQARCPDGPGPGWVLPKVTGFIAMLRKSLRAGLRPPVAVIGELPKQLRALLEAPPEQLGQAQAMEGCLPEQRRELGSAIRLGWAAGIQCKLPLRVVFDLSIYRN